MKQLLQLVRMALRDAPLSAVEIRELRTWSDGQWAGVLALAREQSVTGLVSHALSLLPEGEEPVRIPDELFFPLVSRVDGIERRNRQMAALAQSLVERLNAAGVHPQVIKGPETARYYPRPELREYGDIDLYLPPEEMQALRGAVPEGEMSPDGTFHFSADGVDVDVHDHWLDLPYAADPLPAFPGPEATLLMLSVHALKHAVGTGVGLRQLVDLAAASQALDYDPAALKTSFGRLRLGRWNRLASSFLEQYLGIPNRMYPGDKRSGEPLMTIVVEGGNFGHHNPSRTRALAQSSLRRKADTALRFLRRLPFSLRYAPRLAFSSFVSLAKGNLKG